MKENARNFFDLTTTPQSYSKCFIFALILHLAVFIFLLMQLTFPSAVSSGNRGGGQPVIQATAVSEQVLAQYNKAVLQKQEMIKVQQEKIKVEQQQAAIQKKIQAQQLLKQQQLQAQEKIEQAEQAQKLEKAEQEKKIQAQHQAELEKKRLKQQMMQQVKNDLEKEVKNKKEKNEKLVQQMLKKDLQKQLSQDQSELDQHAQKNAGSSHSSDALSGQQSAEIDKYKALVIRAISQQWVVPDNLKPNLSCELAVRVAPGGVVLSVSILNSSGNTLLDNSAIVAVKKASPLPVPSDAALFDSFRELHLTVKPDGSMVEE